MIDFKEIPAGNTGGEGQDQFELFSRDFLEHMGFEIIIPPSRGADGKVDMIVYGNLKRRQKIRWLVSCKHNAHSQSKRSVNDRDEINILERLRVNKCQGFLGMYSTVPAKSLVNILEGLSEANKIQFQLFDHRRIEGEIINYPKRHFLFLRYFPISYEKYKIHLTPNSAIMNETEKISKAFLSEEQLLRTNISAIIIIDIEKIKERYFDSDWDEKEIIIKELHKYSEHTNVHVARYVISFLWEAAEETRYGLTEEIATSIYTLIVNFFPYSNDEKDSLQIIELANQCCHTASSMIYDASIKKRNYQIIMYGLTILKYMWQIGKRPGYAAIHEKVDEVYSELEHQLNRDGEHDLKKVAELLGVFKNDRNQGTLTFPELPDDLYNMVYPHD